MLGGLQGAELPSSSALGQGVWGRAEERGRQLCVCLCVCESEHSFQETLLRGWVRIWAQGSVSPGIETQASGKDKHCYQDLRVRLCKMGRIPTPLEA